ncbi:hypothetical protein RvY_19045-3 [Ramazzottius varieornatus]|nr:hypothetical protein RvY_19045-3 [Ramazzottius varieornatus]
MSVVPPDLQGKAKWPTRITMGARATGSRTVSVSVLSLCQFYNWSTIVLACDEPENGRSCSTAQAVKRDLAAVLSDVEIVVFDGFTPSFNYIAALTVLSEKARVVIYSGMSKQAMRNILITAYNLNMTNGEYVHIFYWNYATGFTWRWNDKDDQIVRQAYDSVIILEQDQSRDAPPKGTPYYRIKYGWRQRSEELFNFTYSLSKP